LICDREGLEPVLQKAAAADEIYLDTEADSLHHYAEKVCLIQLTVATADVLNPETFLIDPLSELDLAPLFEGLKSKLIIFHGADYDLRMLLKDFEFVPHAIFDTMLAARLAGQTGLGLDALVNRYTGQHLDAGAQKADWSQRPLPPRLLKYAMEDTHHLPLIYQKLREELSALGRLEWHRQQCAQLIELAVASRGKVREDPWRVKGSFDLDSQSLAILKELWMWRDQESQDWDRPPYMVCSNEKLIELVNWARNHPQGSLRSGPILPKRWPPRRFQALERALRQAWGLHSSEWPARAPRGKRPAYDPHFFARLNQLRAVRDAKAKELQLEPSILAPNAILESIAGKNPQNVEELAKTERWLPWQSEVFGNEFLNALKAPQSSGGPLQATE
jgi:ribonuclease D